MDKNEKIKSEFQNIDDDNLSQIGEDIYYHSDHIDTIINDQHIIIDTFKNRDTIIIEKQLFTQELKIIEKLIDRPDFGKGILSSLILIFVAYSIIKKWKCKKKE
jgi:hypothetical protein